MNIKEIATLITRKNYLFDIGIEGHLLNRKNIREVMQQHNSVEDYLHQLVEQHKASQLGVSLFSKNGSSFKKRGFYSVTTGAVATTSPDVATTTNNEQSCPLHGTGDELSANQTVLTMNSQAEILQVRLEFANKQASDLERRNKELERKNDELYTENLKLTRENLTQKDKLELEFKHKEFDLVTEKQNGLNGIMEQVKGLPPEGWQFIAGLFPNHPMGKAEGSPVGLVEGTKKHPDKDASICMDILNELLLGQSGETVAMVCMVAQTFISQPKTLQRAYAQFYPQPSITP